MVIAMFLGGCAPSPTPAPGQTASSNAVRSPAPPTDVAAPGSGGPAATADDQPAADVSHAPVPAGVALPLPRLTDPFEIGVALHDPARVDVGVVSLLAVMGVGIYARDGTTVRAGDEQRAGDPWLFDVEVRELIDRSVEELAASLSGDASLPISMSDLHADLAALLPDRDAGAFTRAYGDAYAEHPDDLVPQVLLGQPVDIEFRMTSVQAWLLMVDGLVGPASDRPASVVPGALLAAGGPRWGTAAATLGPPITQLSTLDRDDFQELMTHLRTLSSLIGFGVVATGVHEGHGGPGDRADIFSWVGPSVPLVSPVSGTVLLEQVNGGRGEPAGLDVRWASVDPSVLRQHGALSVALPASIQADAAGNTTLHYDPRREPADGQGFYGEDFASLYATVSRRNLVESFYVSNDPWIQQFVLAGPLLNGTVLSRERGFPIGFHGPGIELLLEVVYDVTVGVGIGMDAQAHRNGVDSAEGLLTRSPDGTYRGLMRATVDSTTDMTLTLPLAAGECHASTRQAQQLWVVGRVEPGRGLTDRDLLHSGAAGSDDLMLSFYPLEPAGAVGSCDAPIPYTGTPTVDGRAIVGPYLPFNDSRWSQPDVGYRIHLPDEGLLVYDDTEQKVPQWGVDSVWQVTVNRTQ